MFEKERDGTGPQYRHGDGATILRVTKSSSHFLRFRPHKPYRWAANGLADRLGIRRVVFVALDIGLHVLRRHQATS
jgi:hypothetical protein